MEAPLIGITTDRAEDRDGCAAAYARHVARAGATPVLLPAVPARAAAFARRCDGFVLTGGDDPRMEAFGRTTVPEARITDPERQRAETRLLAATGAKPVLGICLGMQWMGLLAGGDLEQHLPDADGRGPRHRGRSRHFVTVAPAGRDRYGLVSGHVCSAHHQAITDPGRLRVIARADDGVIEAIDDPSLPFYLGVQWHPERTGTGGCGAGLFLSLVRAARATGSSQAEGRRR